MTQYSQNSSNPLPEEVADDEPKKGDIVTYKDWNSPHFKFKIVGGGTIPAILDGGFTSHAIAMNFLQMYKDNLKRATVAEKALEQKKVDMILAQEKVLKDTPKVETKKVTTKPAARKAVTKKVA